MRNILMIGLLLFAGCSSLPFPSSNVENHQILSLKSGHSSKAVIEAFGNPIQWQQFDDGSYVHYYTNDWQDGAQVFCRNLAIAYDSNGKLIKHWFTAEVSNPQQRCNNYTAYSAQQAASWSSFANSVNTSLDRSTSSEAGGNSCYNDSSCAASQVCAKKKTIYGTLEMQGVCVNMRYYEEN